MTRDRKAPANTLANTLILAIVIGIAAVSAGDGQRPLNRERAEQPPTRHAGWTTFTNANLVSDMVFDPEGYLWAVGLGGAVR